MAWDLDIAFVGAGNMAAALIEGLIASETCAAERIAASDPDATRLSGLVDRLGIRAAATSYCSRPSRRCSRAFCPRSRARCNASR
jgi:pyrroline-5-carboxylate reductase